MPCLSDVPYLKLFLVLNTAYSWNVRQIHRDSWLCFFEKLAISLHNQSDRHLLLSCNNPTPDEPRMSPRPCFLYPPVLVDFRRHTSAAVPRPTRSKELSSSRSSQLPLENSRGAQQVNRGTFFRCSRLGEDRTQRCSATSTIRT